MIKRKKEIVTKKIAIIGASYLQEPLIRKAQQMGIETHVFAWAADDVGEKIADYFYPISIVEREEILKVCQRVGIDGICSISSDLAMLTVNYIAEAMGLVGNSMAATLKSTNKHLMRQAFEACGDPSPYSMIVTLHTDLSALHLSYPIIVKPTDRSGSRGIFKVESADMLSQAVSAAVSVSFEKKAVIETYVTGQEYSVEYISYQGAHHFLAITLKYTTGAPHFIETGHIQPAPVSTELLQKIKQVVSHALDSLELYNGAAHAEIKVNNVDEIQIIEIGGRMGGDLIGSHLVELSTGIDYVGAVIQVALGMEPDLAQKAHGQAAAVRFVCGPEDIDILTHLKSEHPEYLKQENIRQIGPTEVTDSANRFGYYLMCADSRTALSPYLPGA